MIDLLLKGALIGIGATAAMDIWALLLNKLAGQNMPNWAFVGRWFAHLPRGKVFHDDIADAEPVSGELAIGWVSHYAVGIVYGIVFLMIVGIGWLTAPTFIPAWIFGIVTVGAGWFLLHPGLGLGWAAAKTPNPWKVRAMGLLAHTAFATGMWGTAVGIG